MVYLWSPTDYLNNAQISNPIVSNPLNSVTYNLRVLDGDGCESIQPAIVHVIVMPAAKVFAGNDTTILLNGLLTLNAQDVNGAKFINYTWSPTEGLDNIMSQHPIASITKDITYSVLASTIDGCEATAAIFIKVFSGSNIIVPNAFTPNHDGHNDILKIKLIGIKQLQYFRIYNRWGQQVFSTADNGQGWAGTFNGILQNTGAYVWSAAGIDYLGKSVHKTGSVLLIR
jgi:gliding motility-associated-like protein